MTDALIGWLILGGIVVLIMLFKRKKPPSIPHANNLRRHGQVRTFRNRPARDDHGERAKQGGRIPCECRDFGGGPRVLLVCDPLMTAKDYLIAGAVLLVGWFLISRPLTREELAARRRQPTGTQKLMRLMVFGGCVWFAWWVLSTHCGGGC